MPGDACISRASERLAEGEPDVTPMDIQLSGMDRKTLTQQPEADLRASGIATAARVQGHG